jgi:hypothetical protein
MSSTAAQEGRSELINTLSPTFSQREKEKYGNKKDRNCGLFYIRLA